MGLGRFGGGIAVTRWLAEQGARVTVTDLAPAEKLADSVEQLKDLPVTFHLGGHDETDLAGCDLMVVSPAVPREKSEFVAEAVRRAIPLSSEMNLFIERCPSRCIVGVTGSAGKSTTTAMLGAVLEAAAKAGEISQAWVGGNIGRSLLSDLEQMKPDDVVVLELSSFQLDNLGPMRWSPNHAVITNIRPNHLDRHGTLEAYTDAKMNIVRSQSASDHVYILDREEELANQVQSLNAPSTLNRFAFDEALADAVHVSGRHNKDNAAAAIAVARRLNVGDEAIRRGLATFSSLPHRLAFVAEHKGVRYYNDSKSTTPESTCIAIDAFDRPVVVLVGGKGKGASFAPLGRYMARHAKAVICYGEVGPEIAGETKPHTNGDVPVVEIPSLEEAVRSASAIAEAGDVVVLSPACASYDAFINYEQRGEAFCKAVEELLTREVRSEK